MNNKQYFFSDSQPPDQLMDFLLGPIRWQMISVALELSLFDALTEPTTRKIIAKRFSMKEKQTELLLNGLCSLGILKKENAFFQLEKRVEPYLVSHSRYSMRDMLLHLSNVKHTDNDKVKEILKTGRSDHIAANFRNETFWKNSQSCLYSFHNSINNDTVMDILRNLPEWDGLTSLLDLGAGSESLCQAIHKEKSTVQTTLFDLPSCTNTIKKRLTDTSSIRVLSGDFNIDDIGKDYDIIWASMSLYYAKDLNNVLMKIKQSLNKGGIFLSFHEALREERTLPESHITGRFLPSISGSDLSFDDGVIANQLKTAGFARITSRHVSMPIGDMRLDIAYC